MGSSKGLEELGMAVADVTRCARRSRTAAAATSVKGTVFGTPSLCFGPGTRILERPVEIRIHAQGAHRLDSLCLGS